MLGAIKIIFKNKLNIYKLIKLTFNKYYCFIIDLDSEIVLKFEPNLIFIYE